MISSYLRRVSKRTHVQDGVPQRTLFICRIDQVTGIVRETSVSYHLKPDTWGSSELQEYRVVASSKLQDVLVGLLEIPPAAFTIAALEEPEHEDSPGDPYEFLHCSTPCISDEDAEKLAASVYKRMQAGDATLIFSWQRVKNR